MYQQKRLRQNVLLVYMWSRESSCLGIIQCPLHSLIGGLRCNTFCNIIGGGALHARVLYQTRQSSSDLTPAGNFPTIASWCTCA